MSNSYDVIVVGSGPGGYVCAIRCAQLGMSVACIDRWQDSKSEHVLGGTCLNVGCIPSKALLDSSHHYWDAKEHFGLHGVEVKPALDLRTMMERKQDVVAQLRRGVAGLLRASKVDVLKGTAQLLPNKQVSLNDDSGAAPKVLDAQHVVLAAGSKPLDLKSCPKDDKYIVDSTGALSFDKVPKRLGIIGAGVIGLELGSVWRRLGASVQLLEALPDFLPAVDKDIATETLKICSAQGLDVSLNTRVQSAKVHERKVQVEYELKKKKERVSFDRLIVAVGRVPESDGLLAPDSGVVLDERGFVDVDGHCRTAVPGVYAIGDLVRGPMLAHKASEEGVMVAEHIAGKQPELDYDLIPGVIYTHPEVAWVGKSRQQLDAEGIDYKVGVFPFAAIGRAVAAGDTAGKVVLLAARDTDRILGCHVVGARASELIQQLVLMMELRASTEDIALSVFAHPTFSEAVHEAALALDGRAIHMPATRPTRRGKGSST